MMMWILSIAFLLVSFLAGDLWIDQDRDLPYDEVVAIVGFVVVAVFSPAAGVVALTYSTGVWIWIMVGIEIRIFLTLAVMLMMMTMTVKVRMFAHTPHVSVRLELIKISRKTREKETNLTKTRFWTQLVIAPSLDALSTDALVERVHPARGSVRHGGGEEVVGWGVLHLDNDDDGDCIEKEEDDEDWSL